MVRAMLQWLHARGHECRVLTTAPMLGGSVREETQGGIRIQAIFTEEERIEAFRWADVVFTHLDMTGQCCLWAQQEGVPLVHIIHNANQLRWHKVSLYQAQMVIYNSYWLARAVQFPAPSLVVHPPIFVSQYRPTTEDLQQRRDRIMLVNLNENKGGNFFWGWAGLWPERKFLGVPGAYGDQYLGPIGGLPNVDIISHNDNMRSVYARASVVLVPSKNETWGRVAIEAMAAGVPVIVSPTEGLREAIGSAGVVVSRDDTEALDKALRMLESPDEWEKASVAGHLRALELERTVEVQLRAMESALLTVAANRPVRVWAVASETHYVDHIAPVMHNIHPSFRGALIAFDRRGGDSWGAMERAMSLGVPAYPVTGLNVPKGEPAGVGPGSLVYVVSQRDRMAAQTIFKQVVRGEHGAGQSYANVKSPSFIGTDSHTGCVGATVPSQEAASKLRAAGFVEPICMIGCPKLEAPMHLFQEPKNEKPIVAITFRYPGGEEVCPEIGSAWPAWSSILDEIKLKYEVILHAHPRAWSAFPDLIAAARRLDIPVVEDFEDVLRYADVFICDNSSAALEWLALRSGGLILMNIPSYRRWMKHGLRFWDMLSWPGVHAIDQITQVNKMVELAVTQMQDETAAIAPTYYDPTPESLESGAGRAAAFLEAFLDHNDTVMVKVLRSCDGGVGKLVCGELRSINRRYAEQLEQRKLVAIMPAKGDPAPLPSKLGEIPADWLPDCQESLRAWEIDGWRRRTTLSVNPQS
jgi:hypothetical protein